MHKVRPFVLILLLVFFLVNFLYAVKVCPKCHKQYDDDKNYCPQCGVRLKPLVVKKTKPPQVIRQVKVTDIKIGSGTLEIKTEQEKVSVYLNDELVGYTPFKVDTLEAGEYKLRLTCPGYEDFSSTLEILGPPKPASFKDLTLAIAKCDIEDKAKNVIDDIEVNVMSELMSGLKKETVFADIQYETQLLSYNLKLVPKITNISKTPKYKDVLDKESYQSARERNCLYGGCIGSGVVASILLVLGIEPNLWWFLLVVPFGLFGGHVGWASVHSTAYLKSELDCHEIVISIEYELIDTKGNTVYKNSYSVKEIVRKWEDSAKKIPKIVVDNFVNDELNKIKKQIKEHYKWE